MVTTTHWLGEIRIEINTCDPSIAASTSKACPRVISASLIWIFKKISTGESWRKIRANRILMQQVFSLCSVVISSTLGRAKVHFLETSTLEPSQMFKKCSPHGLVKSCSFYDFLFHFVLPMACASEKPLKGFADEDRSLYVFVSQGRLQRIIRGGPAFEVTKCDALNHWGKQQLK